MNNLTPEQMAWLQQQQNAVALKSNSGWSPNYQPNGWSPGFDPNGDFWTGGFTAARMAVRLLTDSRLARPTTSAM